MSSNRFIQKLMDKIRPSSLIFRLTVLVMTTTVLVLIAASSFISTKATAVIELNSNEHLSALNRTLASTVSVWLESPLNAMQNLVSQPDIVSMNPARQKPLLQIMATAYPYMYLISTTDLRGINVARNDSESLKDYSDRKWFAEASRGVPVAFESVIAKTIGRPALVVSVPIRGRNGKIVGVSMFATDLDHLSQRVQVSMVGKTGIAYVVDRQNRVIAHPNPAFTNELRDLSSYAPIKALRAGKPGPFAFTDDNGQLWRANLSLLENGWGIVVQQPDKELLTTKQMIQEVTFFAVIISVLLLVCSTWLIVRKSLMPVKILSDAVAKATPENMSQPDLEPVRLAAIKIRSNDEVGTLAASFNSMASRLQSTLASLNQELAEHRITAVSLRASEEKYRSLVNNLNIGVYQNTLDLHGHFIQANPAMLKIFGYDSLDEFQTISVSSIYQNPEDRGLFVEEITNTGSIRDKELALQKKDGTPIWASVSTTLQKDEFGENSILYGVIEDITEKKKLESQLRQAQKMEAIGTFSGGIAHDFNNILTAIIGYCSLLRLRLGEADPLRHYADDILSASEKATKLTQSLLAFSRKQVIKPTNQNLNEIVTRVEKFLHRIIGEDIEFKTQLADEELTILADSSQIEQVLMNLATNGRDAMPDGGVLSITTERAEIPKTHNYMAAGSYAVISVSDCGKGMDETTKQRIFEPFFTTKEAGKGTGLGLSIVYGIIKQHNGEINVYSEPGKGTTFKVYLKLIPATKEAAEEESAAPLIGGTETILLAEDNDDVRVLMHNILEEFGYTVIEAVDGEDAISKFVENAGNIQLLILDVVMPRKNGKEAYDHIRKLHDGIPALFSSGYTADIIHQKGILEEGMNFISKPVTPLLLLTKVREVLDKAMS